MLVTVKAAVNAARLRHQRRYSGRNRRNRCWTDQGNITLSAPAVSPAVAAGQAAFSDQVVAAVWTPTPAAVGCTWPGSSPAA